MAKELLFYDIVMDFTAAGFINELEQAEIEREDITLRINSGGGDVFSGWGMIAKFAEFSLKKMVKVDGTASSMLSFFLLFTEESQALRQSNFVLHRAAGGGGDPTSIKILENINAELRRAFEAKINIEKFEKIAGVTVERFFDATQDRVDVVLNAFQAQEIGLVKNVTELSPTEVEAVNKLLIAANAKPLEIEQKPNTVMTLEELKAQHPALYASVVSAEQKAGAEKERLRIQAWNAFQDVAPDEVKAGIESGNEPTMPQVIAFTKLQAKAELEADSKDDKKDKNSKKSKKDSPEATADTINDDAPDAVDTDDPEGGEDDKSKELKEFDAALDENLKGIKL